MAISVKDAKILQLTGDNSSITVDMPTLAVGDFLVAVISSGGVPPDFTLPPGWTKFVDYSFNTNFQTGNVEMYYRFVDGSEGSSLTATPANNTNITMAVISLVGVDKTNPIDSTGTSGSTDTTRPSPDYAPQVVTSTDGAYIMYVWTQLRTWGVITKPALADDIVDAVLVSPVWTNSSDVVVMGETQSSAGLSDARGLGFTNAYRSGLATVAFRPAEDSPPVTAYKLTIDHTKIDDDLSDFPVYFKPSSTSMGSITQAEADSIRIYSDSGLTVEVPREVVGPDEIHFKASLISSTVDTDFWIDYDGIRGDYATDATYGAENVWTNDYAAVWHLNSISGSVVDSTGNGNDGVNDGMWLDTGVMGSGVASDGSTSYNRIEIDPTQLSMAFTHADDMTTTAWIKPNSWSGRSEIIGSRRADSFGIGINSNGTIEGQFDDIFPTSTGTLTFGSWNYVSVVHNGDALSPTADFYINGAYDSSGSSMDANGWATQGYIYIGHESRGNSRLNGVVDEVRVARDTRSPAWLSAEYANQSSPSTFYTVEEEGPGESPYKRYTGTEWVEVTPEIM